MQQQTIFDRSPHLWTIQDVSQFLLLNNMPYLCTLFQEHRVDGAMLLRLSVDDLTFRFHLRSQDAVKLLESLARMTRRTLLPGESIIPVGPTALPPPTLFQSAHVLPPAHVAARQAQHAHEGAHYVPVLLPSDNPNGWRGSVYGEREDATRKAGSLSKLLSKSVGGLLRSGSGAWAGGAKAATVVDTTPGLDDDDGAWGSGILSALYRKNAAVNDLDRMDSMV